MSDTSAVAAIEAPAGTPSRHGFLIVANICLVLFTNGFALRSVSVSLPTLALHFQVGPQQTQWILNSYQLVVIGLAMTMGRLGDTLNRSRLFTVGSAFFAIGTVFCGLSTSLGQMIVFRVIAAIGGSIVVANGSAIAWQVFPGERRGAVQNWLQLFQSLGLMVGPVGAGYLLEALSWRAVFFAAAIPSVLSTLLSMKILPKSESKSSSWGIDPLGSLLLLIACSSLVQCFDHLSRSHLDEFALGGFGLAILALFLLVFVERRVKKPLLEMDLFGQPSFAWSSLAHLMFHFLLAAISLLLPFYMQGVLASRPSQVAKVMALQPLVAVCMTPIVGALFDKIGTRQWKVAGSVVMAVSILGFSRVGLTGHWLQPAAMAASGLGFALFQTASILALQEAAGPKRLGVARGASMTVQYVGYALGTAIAGMLLGIWLRHGGIGSEAAKDVAQWSHDPGPYVGAFQNSWATLVVLALGVVLAAAVRGGARSGGEAELRALPQR